MSTDLSLQQTEAEARRALLDVTSYDVTLDLASDESTFRSVTRLRFDSAGGATFADLKPVAVHAITLNGRAVPAEAVSRGRLPLETAAGENELVVDATMRFRNDGEGLHRSVDPADGRHYVYGMSFMDAAPSIFACFDQPDLKAPYTFHVTAPRDWIVVGNAPGTQVEPGLWELAPSQPLSTYFVTLVAGPYHLITSEHDGIPLGLSARASLAGALERDAEEILTITRQSFDELHRLFGIRYPFGNYHQAFVPEFNAGAMENPGCVTLRDPMIFTSRATRGALINRATTIAHEMAHQWFGNIVTPRWWDDLWLNESFAEYLGNRVTADATDYHDAWADMSYARRQWGLVADQGPSTHPIAGNGAVDALAALQNFDGISYAKGSAILRQLNARLGDEVFFGGVVDHLERHRFGNATMHDLFASWQRAGAGDLSAVTSEWLRKPGADHLRWNREAGVIRKSAPEAAPAERSHTFRVAVARDGRWETESITVTGPETPYAPTAAEAVVLDPYDDTWAVLTPDAATVTALKRMLPAVDDLGLRAGVWNNLRSAFHNALVSPADVVDVAVASIPVEDAEDTPRRTRAWLLGQVAPLAPGDAVARLHAAAVGRLGHVGPGSELQLSTFRLAIATAGSAERLRAWLAEPPAGVELDSDVAWRIRVRLAELGETDRTELDAAFAAGPSAESRIAHTRARCALPDPAEKAYAWSVFTGEVDLPNYEVHAAARGLWAGPEELVTPYADRYFTELPRTAGVRSGWVLGDATDWFFPHRFVSATTLARAEELLARDDLDVTIRRRLADCTDELRRLLAVKEAFPA